MRLYLLLNLMLFSIIFTGCFGTFLAVPHTQEKEGSDTPKNKKLEKNIGEVILNNYDYTYVEGIKLLDDFSASNLLGNIAIPNGSFLEKYINPETEEIFYCGTYFKPITGKAKDYKFCFIEDLGEIDKYIVVYNIDKTYGPHDIDDTISYTQSHNIDKTKPSHKVELIFDGVDRNMILFTYNEYSNSLTRPIFSSQIRYYLKKDAPTMISYKDARIKIYKANSRKITYKIVKPFIESDNSIRSNEQSYNTTENIDDDSYNFGLDY